MNHKELKIDAFVSLPEGMSKLEAAAIIERLLIENLAKQLAAEHGILALEPREIKFYDRKF